MSSVEHDTSRSLNKHLKVSGVEHVRNENGVGRLMKGRKQSEFACNSCDPDCADKFLDNEIWHFPIVFCRDSLAFVHNAEVKIKAAQAPDRPSLIEIHSALQLLDDPGRYEVWSTKIIPQLQANCVPLHRDATLNDRLEVASAKLRPEVKNEEDLLDRVRCCATSFSKSYIHNMYVHTCLTVSLYAKLDTRENTILVGI